MPLEKNIDNSDTVHPLSRGHNYTPSILDGLPTLDDVLHRQSQPPVCLYNYYIVLRDRLELETLLDFWLDVAQADILYKRYVKYATRRRSSNIHRMQQLAKPSVCYGGGGMLDNRSPDILTQMLLLHPRASIATTMYSTTTTTSNKKPPPTQQEMVDIIERIYLRYIVPSAEKEINQLPDTIKETIGNYFLEDTKSNNINPDNPIIYAQAKNYVHQILESTFPLFLRYKVFMNLTLPQQIGRLASGLVLLLVGFSLEFSLIFLDVHPWQKRLWGLLPIAAGIFCTVTSITGVDPVWVLAFNLSETVPFNFNHIIQQRVKHILQRRSFIVLGVIFGLTLISMLIFCAVAGKRL